MNVRLLILETDKANLENKNVKINLEKNINLNGKNRNENILPALKMSIISSEGKNKTPSNINVKKLFRRTNKES